jgi:hypothetical protein
MFVTDLVFKYLKKIEKKECNTLIPLGVWIVLISNIHVEEKMQKNVKRNLTVKAIGPYQSAIVNERQMYEQIYIMYVIFTYNIISPYKHSI